MSEATPFTVRALLFAAAFAACAAATSAGPIDLGRNDVRIYSSPFRPPLGATVEETGLAERLDRLGYVRVHERPDRPGEYFWGHEIFWVYRRAAPVGTSGSPSPRLVGWRLERPAGRLAGYLGGAAEVPSVEPGDAIALEPELLATSFDERRARRSPIDFDDLPEHVWRALLAIEDNRFFEHHGVDGRAVARALLANVRSGNVVQGGSTITQQLIKLRDLSPKRSLGRKASEALRALALEAEHSKEEILAAYLNSVYYGHADGLALYGIDAAARAYYSTSASRLSLAQGAALAALVQAPNRLSPVRNADALASRFHQVLDRLDALEWAPKDSVERARLSGLPPVQRTPPRPESAFHFRSWIRETVGGSRGAVAETTLDARFQTLAEEAVTAGLAGIRRRRPQLASSELSAALVALDSVTGDVLAYVGGAPGEHDEFDRVRFGRRQPGSTVKPLVMLEALASCGSQKPLFASRRVTDAPLTLELESGDWSPQNADRTFRGTVTVHQTLTESLNVPTVRVARHCGFDATAKRLRRAGLSLPASAPPSFALGAVETSPLELATAYTLFANGGRILRPNPVHRVYRPGGRRLFRGGRESRKVTSPSPAYLVFDLLRRPDLDSSAFGKTGSSSELRDAWYAGGSGRLIAVVWVGLDDGRPLGLSGAAAAEPIWRQFVSRAAPSLGPHKPKRPDGLAQHWIDPTTGLRLDRERPGAEQYWFSRRARPPKRHWWRRRSPLEPIE